MEKLNNKLGKGTAVIQSQACYHGLGSHLLAFLTLSIVL